MGGLDEDDYEEGIPDMDEQTLIRSRVKYEENEIALRQKALSKILSQVGGDFQKAKKTGLDIGGDIEPCLTKFDPKRIKLRRAYSLSNVGEEDSWICDETELEESAEKKKGVHIDLSDEEEEEPKRRYSFPLTPKRMTELAAMPETDFFSNQIEDIKEA